ncbi:hypothetical protein [Bacillus thuringiensis]|uniref:hypothetical protein n=1 Tax=Bacillus thuringiensis TaxID=1428 RepID=UPI000BF33ED8|nr:hypothetical protein [Bacillus thuringiensis]PES46092.1 hypothetical protein CN499_21540 [Bacillus thuringiensis]
MNDYGFYLSKLSLRGENKRHAEITFNKGLNLISGASDTGKTFVFQCIDFVFGGREAPKKIKESKGYDVVLLELHTYSGEILTLRRNLTDKKMYKYYCELANIDTVAPIEIKNQHDKENQENISSILLDLCKAPYKNIIKNKKGHTVSFSFRDFAHITMMSEKRIIGSCSPIYAEESRYTKTKSESAFRTIMTGKDDTLFEENKQTDIKKVGAKAKLEIIDNMMLETRISIEELTREIGDKEFKGGQFEQEINFLKSQEAAKTLVLNNLQQERNNYWMVLQEAKSEKMLLSEAIQRFNLLKKNYESDLDRLDFIEEAIFYTEQLVDVKCPVCDGPFNFEETDVKSAVLAELRKTRLQLNDLIFTIMETEEKEEKKELEIIELNVKIREVERVIQEQLQPILFEFQNRINSVIDLRDKYQKIKFNKERLNELIRTQEELKQLINKKQVKLEFDNSVNQNSLHLFSQIVQGILTDWHLEKEIEVKFDEEKNDIIINGKIKEGFGKGYAAILNSAFVIGVLEYTIKLGLPHPRIVIIDSPLTTYKEKDTKEDEDQQTVQEEVKDAFFKYLSTYKGKVQFIILDNIEPKKEIQERINYCRFTGNETINRYGFIPNKN